MGPPVNKASKAPLARGSNPSLTRLRREERGCRACGKEIENLERNRKTKAGNLCKHSLPPSLPPAQQARSTDPPTASFTYMVYRMLTHLEGHAGLRPKPREQVLVGHPEQGKLARVTPREGVLAPGPKLLQVEVSESEALDPERLERGLFFIVYGKTREKSQVEPPPHYRDGTPFSFHFLFFVQRRTEGARKSANNNASGARVCFLPCFGGCTDPPAGEKHTQVPKYSAHTGAPPSCWADTKAAR